MFDLKMTVEAETPGGFKRIVRQAIAAREGFDYAVIVIEELHVEITQCMYAYRAIDKCIKAIKAGYKNVLIVDGNGRQLEIKGTNELVLSKRKNAISIKLPDHNYRSKSGPKAFECPEPVKEEKAGGPKPLSVAHTVRSYATTGKKFPDLELLKRFRAKFLTETIRSFKKSEIVTYISHLDERVSDLERKLGKKEKLIAAMRKAVMRSETE